MARQAKEREPFFTQMEFDSAMYAMDIRDKCEKKMNMIKIGLIIAAVAEVAWILYFKVTQNDFFALIGLVGTIAAYVVGGGFGLALKGTWKLAKTLGWIGWFCVPFPADIFTGLLIIGFTLIFVPFIFIFIPLVMVGLNFIQVNKDYKAAEEYLQYCTPVDATVDTTYTSENVE